MVSLRDTENNPIWFEEVVERVSLLEKLWIRTDDEGELCPPPYDLVDLVGRTDRNSRLREDDLLSFFKSVALSLESLTDALGDAVSGAPLLLVDVALGGFGRVMLSVLLSLPLPISASA